MILYAPFYSVLVDSSHQAELEKKVFPTIKHLLKFLAEEYHNSPDIEDIFISYLCYSKKIHRDVYDVSTRQLGSLNFNSPRYIGCFTFL